ncbi:PhnD/SsuA/transferrin family substrate-binding protein [Pseudoalteromonas sp. OOF1S-7]|nr:PhnD/SsuA/transferrin family substrate-binding protein [Pseudoalteromonas sp. OOF1S-7]MCG7534026.1 PhnD/SsuA/transferrin family substrate-binding protein [Pseudoalteromonas sp. OOF1S-7]
MKYNHSLSNKTTIVTVLFLSVWCCWLLASNLTGRPVGELPKLVESSVSCKTRSTSNMAVFRVHVPVEPLARRLAPALCQDDVVAKQYGRVEVRYSGELAEQIDYIAKGLADLTLSKDNVMAALKAQSTYNYMPVVGYPTYTAFFISNREKPRLDKAYFLDKKIGLLDYPTSRSGHIIPKQMFKRLDLDMRVLDIQYVSSHQVLREKLSSGELDIIATYWQESDESRFSANYITPIGENISGSRWYVKMDVDNTDLACALQQQLQEVAKNNGSSYFDELDLYWQCDALPVYFLGERDES